MDGLSTLVRNDHGVTLTPANDRPRKKTFRNERGPGPNMATIGKKECGCVIFARLGGMRHRIPVEKVTKNLTVEVVPLSRSHVTICRCES